MVAGVALYRWTIQNPLLDTQVIARALFPSLSSYGLDSVLALHGIEPAGRHTASGDAWLTARLFSLQLELPDVMRIQTLGDLYVFLKSGDQVVPGSV
jgi:DNA polymerase-3 subunit epsilon